MGCSRFAVCSSPLRLPAPSRARPPGTAENRIAGVEPMRPGISSVISVTQSRGVKAEMRSSKPSAARAPISGDPMSRRAARLGIETQYRDVQGRQQMADPQGLARVTAALAESKQPARRLLPATVILRGDRDLRLRLKTGARTAVRWEILPEANGSDASDAIIAAGTAVASVIALPADLPPGSYRLKVVAQSAGKERAEEATLLRAARPGLSGAGGRTAALYGRWRRSFTACGRSATGAMATSPISSASSSSRRRSAPPGLRSIPCMLCSTIAPRPRARTRPTAGCFSTRSTSMSTRSRNFPGLRQPGSSARWRSFRSANWSITRAWRAPRRGRWRWLTKDFRGADAARRAAFESFRRERGPVLARFACFEFLRRRFGTPWPQWPPQWRNPTDAALAALRERDGDGHRLFRVRAMGGRSAARRLPPTRAGPGLADRALSRHRGRGAAGRLRCLERSGFGHVRACGRSAARPLQHRRAELGFGGIQSGRLGGAAIPAVPANAARLDAQRRRHPARSRAGAQAPVPDSGRDAGRAGRLCPLSVRGASGGRRAGERASSAAS